MEERTDNLPERVERAEQQVFDLVDALRQTFGNYCGLVEQSDDPEERRLHIEAMRAEIYEQLGQLAGACQELTALVNTYEGDLQALGAAYRKLMADVKQVSEAYERLLSEIPEMSAADYSRGFEDGFKEGATNFGGFWELGDEFDEERHFRALEEQDRIQGGIQYLEAFLSADEEVRTTMMAAIAEADPELVADLELYGAAVAEFLLLPPVERANAWEAKSEEQRALLGDIFARVGRVVPS